MTTKKIHTRKVQELKTAKLRSEIVRLYLQGITQAEIGVVVDGAQHTVSAHLKHVQETWLRSADLDMSEIVARELAKLDLIEQEAWKQWARCCEERIQEKREKEEVIDVEVEAGPLGEPILQRLPCDVFHRDEGVIPAFPRFVDMADIGMIQWARYTSPMPPSPSFSRMR